MRSGGFLVFASMNRAVLFLSIPDLKECLGASPRDHVSKNTNLEDPLQWRIEPMH